MTQIFFPARGLTLMSLAGLCGLLVGCGAQERTGAVSAEQLGLSASNGLSINGLSINGLSINGLSINGLSNTAFSAWFNQTTALTPSVMSYIVKCALPADQSLSWTNPASGAAYTWPGELGLAPGWASGKAATVTEQQLITACLGAHANRYGLQIPISVAGRDASGVALPFAPGELSTYSVREGCFFGNLFDDEGMYAGLADVTYRPANSSPRACALDVSSASGSSVCPPLVDVGLCASRCTLDATGTYYTRCTYGGKSYAPLLTRIVPADVYTCGDGVCQFTESCGSGATAASCGLDCGACPGTAMTKQVP